MAGDELLQRIIQVTRRLSPSVIVSISDIVESLSSKTSHNQRVTLACDGAPPATRAEVEGLIGVWNAEAPDLSPVAFAWALRAASTMDDYHRVEESVELVWTGPDVTGTDFRRTDQALLEIIERSKETLTIVTFAAYKVPEIAAALVDAARRGVALTLILEHKEAGKVDFDGFHALGPDLTGAARFYVWPLKNRPKSASGHPGTMHVKCALADENVVLLSSANLTEFALNINMEMGVTIRGGAVPIQVATHFRELIQTGTLTSLNQM